VSNGDVKDKSIGYAKSKRRIKDLDSDPNIDLADRIDALQRAVANERGENERFREEMRAKVRLLLEGRSY
jgi:hypothetical protein